MLIINRKFIDKWSGEYDKRYNGTSDQLEETAILNWLSKQNKPKFLNKKYFIKLGLWKTPRYAARRKTNSDKTIIEKTRSAYLSQKDLEKLTILQELGGVGVAVASTILYYLQPDNFAIFDYHVRNTLKEAGKLAKGKEDDSNKVWLKYTNIIRYLSISCNKTLREVEKALFAYDKWRGGGIKCAYKGKGVRMATNKDEKELIVYLPAEKMELLENVANVEFGIDASIVARFWIIDQLRRSYGAINKPRSKPSFPTEFFDVCLNAKQISNKWRPRVPSNYKHLFPTVPAKITLVYENKRYERLYNPKYQDIGIPFMYGPSKISGSATIRITQIVPDKEYEVKVI